MSNLEYFKKQAKNLLKDWQTQTKTVEEDGLITYNYSPKFYDVGDLFFHFEFNDKDEQDIKLARAQHLIAKIAGFKKWDELVHASSERLELAELILRHIKNSEDLLYWESSIEFSGIPESDYSAKLEYGKNYFKLDDSKQIVNDADETLKILTGKDKQSEINKLISDGIQFKPNKEITCSCCESSFRFKESKVIHSPTKQLSMVVCKNFPNCRGTYLDYYDPDDDPYGGKVPFDSDMDQGYVDEFE